METETEDYMEKCEAIFEWARDRPEFSTSFVQDIYDRLEKGEALSQKQQRAIDNIIDGFKIEC